MNAKFRLAEVLLVEAVVAFAGSALAQDATKMIKPDGLAWRANAILPKGAQTAVLIGDPTKAGDVVVLRVKYPPNYQVPPHTHPFNSVITVISGSISFGVSDKFDTSRGDVLTAGSVFAIPAKQVHYEWTGNEEAITQVQYIGPSGIDYVNPGDDPRKK